MKFIPLESSDNYLQLLYHIFFQKSGQQLVKISDQFYVNSNLRISLKSAHVSQFKTTPLVTNQPCFFEFHTLFTFSLKAKFVGLLSPFSSQKFIHFHGIFGKQSSGFLLVLKSSKFLLSFPSLNFSFENLIDIPKFVHYEP